MSFWRGQHIVVTGGAGMIGVPVVRMLVAKGVRVRVLDDFSRGSTRVNGALYTLGDASNLETCMDAMYRVDGLINMAAHVGGVSYNQGHHSEMLERNLLLQTVPLVAAERLDVGRVVQVSSVCVYAPEHQCPAREELGLDGQPHAANLGYSMAKRLGELACQILPNAVRVRPTNAYGPLDYYGRRAHVIPAIIRKAHEEGHKLTLMGSGQEKREFIYSEDVAKGIVAAYRLGRRGQCYNLGTGGQTVTDIANLARLIVRLVNGREAELSFDPAKGGGDMERCTASGLAAVDLGWHFRVRLEEGLAITVEDYLERVA